MFRNLLMSVAALALATTATLAQRGSVVSVDSEQKLIVVKVGEADYKVDANKVTLLDSDGNATKLTAFAAKDKVLVTMANQIITTIQKLREQMDLSAALPAEGKIVRVDAENGQIVVRVGESEHTAMTSKCKLLDKDGNAAKIGDFATGDKVHVTLADGIVTVIQRAK